MKKRMGWGFLVIFFLIGSAGMSFGATDIRFGFSLSGGMSNIDGGDFNQNIRDNNTWIADYEDYWNERTYTIDWKEMKWMPKYGGEFTLRFGRYFGVGLGVEFIKKTNPGTIENAYEDSVTNFFPGYYQVISENYESTESISQTMTVIPVTLSLYGFLPLGPRADAYLKLGGGYYFGKISHSMTGDAEVVINENYYWNSGTPFPPHFHAVMTGTGEDTWEATCNTFGFHVGAGFAFNVSSNIALFGEAFYRFVNFTDWRGSALGESVLEQRWGWTDSLQPTNLPNSDTISADEDFEGRLWYYEDIWEDFDTEAYGYIDLFEDEPEETDWTKHVRPAEINLNGFNFKVGIRIFFGGKR